MMKRYLLIPLLLFLTLTSSATINCLGFFDVKTPTVAEIGATSLTISWFSSSNADSYAVEYKLSTSSTYTRTSFNSGLSRGLTGLQAGRTYNIRVVAKGLCGTFEPIDTEKLSTNTISVTMEPPAPVTSAATSITQTSFVANWNTTTGATGYRIDVATNSSFTTLVYNNISSTSLSRQFTNLLPGTIYYFRVRATNAAGTSVNSSHRTVITVPDETTVLPATNIQNNAFTAKWNSTPAATSYELYVSTTASFSSHVTGFNGTSVSGTSKDVTGLTSGRFYYYRVKSVNSSGISEFSDVAQVLMPPSPPVIIGASDAGIDRFKVSWNMQTLTDSYEIYIATDEAFTSPVPGYSPKHVSGLLTETYIEGLLPSTIYYIRMKGVNQSGSSAFSIIKLGATNSGDGSSGAPVVTIETANENQISFTATQGVGGNVSASFRYAAVSTTDFTQEPIPISPNNTYSIVLSEEYFDEFGLRYEIEFVDLLGNVTIKTGTIARKYPQVNLPISSFGKETKHYSIVTIPFELSNQRIEDVLEPILGAYDRSKWRFVHYRDGKNVDYNDGLSVSNFEQGKSYWFISAEEVNLQLGEGTAPANSLENPFIFQLKAGWNQIGNPYPFDLDWASVVEVNGNPASISPNVLLFNKEQVSFSESTIIPMMGGGFVHAETDIDIIVPVSIREVNAGGRTDRTETSSWTLPLILRSDPVTYTLAAPGFSAFAKAGKDRDDLEAVPPFSEFVEFVTEKDGLRLTRDIRPWSAQESWEYLFTTNVKSTEHVIEWSLEHANHHEGPLWLLDYELGKLINMKSSESYEFKGTERRFGILSGYDLPEDKEVEELGVPYPNPSANNEGVSWTLFSDRESQVSLIVTDLSGRPVAQIQSSLSGLDNIYWDGQNTFSSEPLPAGTYLYRIVVTGSKNDLLTGKLIRN